MHITSRNLRWESRSGNLENPTFTFPIANLKRRYAFCENTEVLSTRRVHVKFEHYFQPRPKFNKAQGGKAGGWVATATSFPRSHLRSPGRGRPMALFAVLAGGFSTAISDAGGGTTDSPGANINKSKYCIIGAGPAGVQLGHLMHRAGLDYVVFERGYQAGTFFSKYPIHRRLNSFNRRHTRSTHGRPGRTPMPCLCLHSRSDPD